MAFRRKRPRVVWLPPDRLNRLAVAPAAVANSTQSAIGLGVTTLFGGIPDASQTVTFPVVLDKSPELALTAGVQSLADVTQSSYRLRRVVGKIFITLAQDPGQGGQTPVPRVGLFTAGLIVLRINEEDSQPLQNPAQYDAQSYGNTSDPWIWRRSWILQNAAIPPGPADASNQFAGLRGTADGGSVLDGPHVDAKTARIIGPEERLFLVVTTKSLDADGVTDIEALVTVLWDFRVLASMKSNVGNRRNASR